jgi:hypothetical protein
MVNGCAKEARPMSDRAAWRQMPNGFSLLLIVLLAVNYFVPFADLDFAWQIRTGERIAQTGQLQPTDTFSYTIAGRPVPDFEWLYEVLLWGIWSIFGYGGLKLVKTILVAVPYLLLALRLRTEAVRWHGIALALLTAVFVLSRSWNLRPLFCTTISLLLVSGWLHDHCHGRRQLGWRLPVLMFLWGNLHPAVITGQALLAGAIAWEWLNRWWRINPALDRAACHRLTLIGGLGLAASCLSPHPLERLLYPFRPEVAHPIQRIFAEMQPLYRLLWQPPYSIVLVYLVAVLVALSVALRFRHYRLWEVALLLGLTGLANLAARSLQDWTFIMLALGLPHLAVLLQQAIKQGRISARERVSNWHRGCQPIQAAIYGLFRVERGCKRMLNTPLFRFQWFWPVAGLLPLAAMSVIPPLARQMPIQNAAAWPVAAMDWFEAQGLCGRIFGPPDYGSYVGWRLGECGKCYVDTRGFYFPPELLNDSNTVPQLGPGWPRSLQRILAYRTDYFLLETTGPRGQFWRALQPFVDQPLFRDGQTVLLTAAQVRGALAQIDQTEWSFVSREEVAPR